MDVKKSLSSDNADEVAKYIKKAGDLVRAHCELIPDEPTSVNLIKAMQDCSAMKVQGSHDEAQMVLIVYDQKVVGESCTRPHLRLPVHQAQHQAKLIQAVLKCRSGDTLAIQDGDLFCIPDAGKHGSLAPNDMINLFHAPFYWLSVVLGVFFVNQFTAGSETALLSCFTNAENKPLAKSKKLVYAMYSESSIKSRLKVPLYSYSPNTKKHAFTSCSLHVCNRQMV